MSRSRSDAADSGSQLPPLAPRGNQHPSSRTPAAPEPSRASSAARPRSSHRSRAGCWTCRGRKVKCDEVHPRCGPCTRLNKTCDWDQRWNFSDATQSTQSKFANINTAGNAVWDPNASRGAGSQERSPSRRDSLPSFADLTNDEERERKAEGYRPGTYNVIVNPNSFLGMPEYASPTESGRRMSIQSLQSSMGSNSSEPSRAIVCEDPNTVLLTRFEDSVPSLPSFFMSTDRRTSLPGDMQRLDLSLSAGASPPPRADGDAQLVQYYVQKISPRILALSRHNHESGVEDPILVESRRFPPLHHAICALSLLSLHHRGRARSQDAFERMNQTTGLLAQSVRSVNDLQSDGVFYLHFILLVYDACNPLDDANMWDRHVQHLRQTIMTRRRQRPSENALDYMAGFALWLDTQAALTGRDSGAQGLLRSHMSDDLFPASTPTTERGGIFTSGSDAQDTDLFVFGKESLTLMGKLGILAVSMRSEQHSPQNPSATQQILLARQRAVRNFQTELYEYWTRAHPSIIARENPVASSHLPGRVRHVYDSAFLSLSLCAIYSNTSMFPGQLLRNAGARPEVARHCQNVLDMTTLILRDGATDPRSTGFAVFLAGYAASDYDTKIRAINLLQALEDRGVSNNARRARDLLVAVCEEQRQRVLAGGRAEEVDWLLLAQARRMETLDFGL